MVVVDRVPEARELEEDNGREAHNGIENGERERPPQYGQTS